MGARQQTRAEAGNETRDRVLRLFTEMVAEHGYHGTAIGELARLAGVSKGAVLHHFGTKDGLLVAAGVNYIDRRDAELELAFERLDNAVDQFGAVVYSTILAQRDDRAASRAFGREFSIFKSDPRLQEVRDHRDRYVGRVTEMIERCVDAGVLRRGNIDLALMQIYGMCNWTWAWYRPNGRLSAEEIARRFTRTLLAGLGPPLEGSGVKCEVDDATIVELLREANGQLASV